MKKPHGNHSSRHAIMNHNGLYLFICGTDNIKILPGKLIQKMFLDF
jgi:hypothetical protein